MPCNLAPSKASSVPATCQDHRLWPRASPPTAPPSAWRQEPREENGMDTRSWSLRSPVRGSRRQPALSTHNRSTICGTGVLCVVFVVCVVCCCVLCCCVVVCCCVLWLFQTRVTTETHWWQITCESRFPATPPPLPVSNTGKTLLKQY